MLINIRVEQWEVYGKRLAGSCFAFLNVLSEYSRVHAASPNNAKATGITYGTCQPPAAGPYHTGLNNGEFYFKKGGDAIVHFGDHWVNG